MAETRVDTLLNVILGERPSKEREAQERYDLTKKIVEAAIKSIGMRIKINKCSKNNEIDRTLESFYTNDKNDIVVQLIKKAFSKPADQINVYKVGDSIDYQITMIGDHAISSPHIDSEFDIPSVELDENIINDYIAVLCKRYENNDLDLIVDVAGLAYRFVGGDSPNNVYLIGPYVDDLRTLAPAASGAAASGSEPGTPAAEPVPTVSGAATGGGTPEASGAGGPASGAGAATEAEKEKIGNARSKYRRSRSKKKSNKKLVQRKKRRVSKKKFRR